MKKFSVGRTISICGACIAFYIGAGFATMQEVVQYEASYGSKFLIVIAVAAVIYIYTNLSFATNGHKLMLEHGGDIYRVYCGNKIGTFYDYFAAFFCYMCFIVKCSSANSVATELWGLPNGVGAAVLTVAVVATAVFGLNGIINALGKLGPIIIMFILFVSAWTVIRNFGNFAEGLQIIDSGKYEIEQVGGGNPLLSGASYSGFVILWFASFLAEIGARNDLREVNTGMLASAIAVFAVSILVCMALICCINDIWNVDVPALTLAANIHPLIGLIFAVIIFGGVYTTALPLLWTGVIKLADEGTKKYKLLIVVGGIVGFAIGFLPYKAVLNVLYGVNGYLGFILIAFMIVHDIRMVALRSHKPKQEELVLSE